MRIFFLLLANAVLFSVLGGALLTRYLLPMYPLVLLVAVTTLYRRVPYWHGLALISAAAFFVGLFINPPYGFAPEDNLAYAHVIRMHQAGIAELKKLYPAATVLTAWPMSDELTQPELGYVKQPWEVCRHRRLYRRPRLRAPPRSRRSTRPRWCFPPNTIRLTAREAERRGTRRTLLRPAPRPAAGADRPRTGRRPGVEARRRRNVDRADPLQPPG